MVIGRVCLKVSGIFPLLRSLQADDLIRRCWNVKAGLFPRQDRHEFALL
jgi:hypothetical protein